MHQQWADYRLFWREFRRTFQTTGAVLPSGPALARALARHVRQPAEETPGRRILEVGPGTGSVTARILRAMRAGDRLTMVERNAEFVARLRERFASQSGLTSETNGDGRIKLVHAGVEELPEDAPYDLIISGLPLNNFSIALVEQLLQKMARLLAPGGRLSFFEYIAIRRLKSLVSSRAERERLRGIGAAMDRLFESGKIEHDRVLTNIPPAWVHHVRIGREQGAESRE
jgi:phosphatidylethanolamine/phosphatidyl-N-methylethanolamine N-methyltransferase